MEVAGGAPDVPPLPSCGNTSLIRATPCVECCYTAPSGLHYAKISNLTGIAGEYHLADCFVSAPDRFEGLVDPVVIPRLNDYDVGVVNGVRCVRQKHGTPSPTFDARAITTDVLDFRP